MAVSYLSQTFRNSPYVPPVNLDLMAKVLSYKQSMFDQEAEKLQNQVNQMSSLDVVKGEDRDYLNNKINNIVGNINGMGGVDLGDLNVGNQIESYGSEIYNDPKIINAISSTKQIRNLQDSYEKMRTDPKLLKYYSAANEYDDMKKVNSYLSDQTIGTSYKGNSSATPFQDYSKYYQDILQKVIPQKYTKVSNSNGYIDVETGNVLTEQQVHDIAVGYLTPNMRDQMKRDGSYLYETNGFGKDQIIGKALQNDDGNIQNIQTLVDQLTAAKSAETSPAEKAKLQQAIDAQNQGLTKLKASRATNKDYYNNLYDQNPQEMMYLTYSNDFIDAVSKKFAVNQVDHKVSTDQYQLQGMIQNREDARAQLQSTTAIQLGEMKLAAAGKGYFDESGKFVYSTRNPLLNPLSPNDTVLPNSDQSSLHDRLHASMTDLDNVNQQIGDYTNQLIQYKKQNDSSLTDKQAQLSVQSMLNSLDQSANGQASLIKNMPSNVGDIYEQMQLLRLKRDNLSSSIDNYIKTGDDRFVVPQYSLLPINEDNKNIKDLTTSWKAGLIAKKGFNIDPSQMTILGVSRNPAGTIGEEYNVTYTRTSGTNKKVTETAPISDQTAQAFGLSSVPADLEVLNNYVDSYNPFKTVIQNQNDPNFSVGVQVYKIGEHQFGVKLLYAHPLDLKGGFRVATSDEAQQMNEGIKQGVLNTSGAEWVDITNGQPYGSAADAYATARNTIKNFNPLTANSRDEFNGWLDQMATHSKITLPSPTIINKTPSQPSITDWKNVPGLANLNK